MIEPFEPGQVRQSPDGQQDRQLRHRRATATTSAARASSRSSPTSTARSSTRRNSTRTQLRRLRRRRVHHPAQFVRAGAHCRVLAHPAQRAHDLPGQEHLRPLRHHRQRHASGAGVGRARDAGVLATPRRCRPRSTPARAARRCCSSRATRSARPAIATATASTRGRPGSRCLRRRPWPRGGFPAAGPSRQQPPAARSQPSSIGTKTCWSSRWMSRATCFGLVASTART